MRVGVVSESYQNNYACDSPVMLQLMTIYVQSFCLCTLWMVELSNAVRNKQKLLGHLAQMNDEAPPSSHFI